jgi:hypothetical protein
MTKNSLSALSTMILWRQAVWLSRIHCCRGFGIQSPTDYAFVRYVINEHWPYYAYEQIQDSDWLVQKLGRLYMRLANWRQPQVMLADDYQRYWQAGCRKTHFVDSIETVELARITIEEQAAWQLLSTKCDSQSVFVVEGIWRNKPQWRQMVSAQQVTTAYDLYYCGILLYNKKTYKHHYKINF